MAPPGSHLSLLFDLFAAEQRVRTLIERAMAGAPLTPDEYAVYSVLFDEGPHTPTDLARRVGMPPTTMSHYVRDLIGRGHAIRRSVSSDRRSYRLALTAEGERVHAESGRAFREADERFREALRIEECEARRALTAIGQAAASAEARLVDETLEATG